MEPLFRPKTSFWVLFFSLSMGLGCGDDVSSPEASDGSAMDAPDDAGVDAANDTGGWDTGGMDIGGMDTGGLLPPPDGGTDAVVLDAPDDGGAGPGDGGLESPFCLMRSEIPAGERSVSGLWTGDASDWDYLAEGLSLPADEVLVELTGLTVGERSTLYGLSGNEWNQLLVLSECGDGVLVLRANASASSAEIEAGSYLVIRVYDGALTNRPNNGGTKVIVDPLGIRLPNHTAATAIEFPARGQRPRTSSTEPLYYTVECEGTGSFHTQAIRIGRPFFETPPYAPSVAVESGDAGLFREEVEWDRVPVGETATVALLECDGRPGSNTIRLRGVNSADYDLELTP